MKKTITIFLLTLSCLSMQAATWFVKPDDSSTAWASKEPAQVKTNLLAALSVAVQNDEIWLSAGTHYYTAAAATAIDKHIKIYGGFIGTEAALTERQKTENGPKWDYSNTTILEPKQGYKLGAFTVPSGQNILINGITFQNFTATVLSLRQNTRVEECIFHNNIAPSNDGAAIAMYPGGHVKDCYFLKNSAKSSAGIFANQLKQNISISGCLFEENTTTDGANAGAAINIKESGGHESDKYTALIVNCIFRNNVCNLGNFPGIVTLRTNSASINNCVIANNNGRALDLFAGKASNLTIVNNVGTTADGAVYLTKNTPTAISSIYNSVIWGNKRSAANQAGQGILVKEGDQATISNIASDVATIWAAPATEALFYQLSTSNDGGEESVLFPRFVTPTTFSGAGTDEASIAATRTASYSIQNTSTLIDKGDSQYLDGSIELDIAGNSRFEDAALDLGAYEVKGVGSSVERNNIAGVQIFTLNNILSVEAPASILSLYDMTGATITTIPVQSGKVELSLHKGIYLLNLTTENGDLYSHKVIMQ